MTVEKKLPEGTWVLYTTEKSSTHYGTKITMSSVVWLFMPWFRNLLPYSLSLLYVDNSLIDDKFISDLHFSYSLNTDTRTTSLNTQLNYTDLGLHIAVSVVCEFLGFCAQGESDTNLILCTHEPSCSV